MNEFFRKWNSVFIYIAILSCIINILQLTFSFYMFSIFDVVIQSFSYVSLNSMTFLAIVAIVFLCSFSYLRSLILHKAALSLDSMLKYDLNKFILKEIATPSSQSYRQGAQDLDTLKSFVSSDGLQSIFDIPWAPFYLILIFFFHPLLGFLAFCGALVTLSLVVMQDYFTRERLRKANIIAFQNRNFMDSVLKNSEVINAMGMNEAVFFRFDERNSQILKEQTQASKYAGFSQSAIKSIQVFMSVLIFGFGAWLVITDGFDPGLIIASSIIMGQAISPFMRTIYSAKIIAQAREAYGRLRLFSHELDRSPMKMPLPAPQGDIAVENVSFVLRGTLLLHDISFRVRPGEFLGLIGPNGAGKSTLSRVLLGVWPPTLGAVRLDGVDVFSWNKDELGRHIGYLPQEVELFPATVAENIARMGEVDMCEIERVSAIVGLSELIESLPQGYDTPVGGTGVALSGGQTQRIGLARALYGSPRLLLLDEPNSNLDSDGELMLVEALSKLRISQKVTCVLISHKMSILSAVDHLLMLDGGKIVHYGSRDSVLAAISS